MSHPVRLPSRPRDAVLALKIWEPRTGALAIALILLFALTRPLWAQEFTVGDLVIKRPWSRALPQGAKVAAGYLVIVNRGAAPDRLIGVTAEIAGMAEVHQMAVDSAGVMTMRPVDEGLEIPAGAEVALKPGAFHIMFMDLTRAPKQGDSFAGTLTFEKAGVVAIAFSVDALGGDSGHDGHDPQGE